MLEYIQLQGRGESFMKLEDVSCFLQYCQIRYSGEPMSDTRLWIITYMAQCWHIMGHGTGLFEGRFAKTAQGPVPVETVKQRISGQFHQIHHDRAMFAFLSEVFVQTMDRTDQQLLQWISWQPKNHVYTTCVSETQMKKAITGLPPLRMFVDHIDDMVDAGYLNGIGPIIVPERYMEEVSA